MKRSLLSKGGFRICKKEICSLLLICFTFTVAIFGCAAVGPDYQPPKTQTSCSWNNADAGGLSKVSLTPETLARWWTTLDDPILSYLMDQAEKNNLDLRKAQERVREARARRGLASSALFPFVDVFGSVTENRSSENSGTGEDTGLYALGFDAGWELDVFGGIRRSVASADALLGVAREELHDIMVSLLAETALNYVEARTFQTRLTVAEANIQTQKETYELIRSRFHSGLSDELPVQQALYNLENSRSQIPSLRTGLEASKNRLSVLLGEQPGSLHQLLKDRQPVPVTPITVAVGIPAETLRHRPDIRRAERLLAARTADIGVATADLFPNFALSGMIGLESISTGNLLNWDSRTWSVGPSVIWNVFDAGAIRKTIEIQTAKKNQVLIQYESTILSALEEVENALKSYAEEQLRRQSLLSATEAAQKAVQLAQDRYKAGLVDFSNVLDAQRSLLSFQDQLAKSEGTVTANLIRMYKALGGGWNYKEPSIKTSFINNRKFSKHFLTKRGFLSKVKQ